VTFRYNSWIVAALRFREGFMLEMLMQWYRRRFSDPEAIALLVILLAGFGIMFFFSGLLAPLLVAIVLAYLLEWPTVAWSASVCRAPGRPRWC
jgi:putative permease